MRGILSVSYNVKVITEILIQTRLRVYDIGWIIMLMY